jgi:hypothetical protein
MIDTTRIGIRASTQDHLEIEDIKEDIVILKDGSACLIMAITSINFDLLSEKEQEATIFAYAALLNSLTFPIQIIVRSQQKDISAYLSLVEEALQKESRPLYKLQLAKYKEFIKDTVQKNNVLDKKFFLVIPMSAIEIGAAKAMMANFSPKKRKLPFAKNYILERAKINLYPKRDHLIRLLGRLSINGKQLETKELIKLFFDIYNPESTGQQMVGTDQYQAPIVQSTLPTKPADLPLPSVVNQAKEPIEESMQDKIKKIVNQST